MVSHVYYPTLAHWAANSSQKLKALLHVNQPTTLTVSQNAADTTGSLLVAQVTQAILPLYFCFITRHKDFLNI